MVSLQCKTRNGCQNVVYGSIRLKFFLVGHLTYENHWGKWHSKIRTFGFFGTPYCPKLFRTVMYFAKQKKSRAVEGLLLGKINQNLIDWNLVEFCQVGRL